MIESQTLAERLSMEPEDWQTVETILATHIPAEKVWAFGSRATGRYLKKYSDLDLAFPGELDEQVRADLACAFEESLLPIKVDMVEEKRVDADFWDRIRKDFIVLRDPQRG